MMALAVLRYTLLLLVIPAYFIALSRRWWTTIPLWLVSTAVMLTQFLMAAQQSAAFGTGAADDFLVYVGEMTKIMLIPMVVQFAIALRGMGIRAVPKFMCPFESGERCDFLEENATQQ